MSETQKCWFVARTRDKQELAICKSFSRLKSEEHLDIDYYLLTRIVASRLKYRRKRSEVPITRNLVLIYTTKQTACSLSNVYGVRLFYMKDLFTRSMFAAPSKQMSDSMFMVDLNPDDVSFDDGFLVVGGGVCVVRGDFTGVEGEAVINANRTYVIIRIKDILTASVRAPESCLKIIK